MVKFDYIYHYYYDFDVKQIKLLLKNLELYKNLIFMILD